MENGNLNLRRFSLELPGFNPPKFLDEKARFNIASHAFEEKETQQSIIARFDKIVAKYPEKIAIQSPTNAHYTYMELFRVSNQIARLIENESQGTSNPVLIFMSHDSLAIAVMLGVLRSARAYIPIDPSYPEQRIEYILDNSQAQILFSDKAMMQEAQKLSGKGFRVLETERSLSGFSQEKFYKDIEPESLAYILYTSGSTGEPKGVMQTHRNLLHFIRSYSNSLGISEKDRMTILPSYGFSASLMDIYGGLLSGATVYPFAPTKEGIEKMSQWLSRERITVYHSVPTLFRSFLESLGENSSFPDLRVFDLGGEEVKKRDVDLFREHFGKQAVLVNHLACTEASVLAQYFIDQDTFVPENKVPSGYAGDGIEIFLLDENNQQVSDHCVGEIAIQSPYLSPGYWEKQDLTQKSFITIGGKRIYKTGDLGKIEKGLLVYSGRKDMRVKVRGFTIELAEIESAILSLGIAKDVAVVCRETPLGNSLVAYLQTSSGLMPGVKALKKVLGDKIPSYMVPAILIALEEFPHTPNGKTDRKALQILQIKRPVLEEIYLAPQNEEEKKLVQICEKILQISPIGIQDSLSDLGMDSIRSFQMLLEIEKILGKKISIENISSQKTIQDIAGLIVGEEKHSVSSADSKHDGKNNILSGKHFNPDSKSWKYAFRILRNKLFLKAMIAMIPYSTGIRFLLWFCSKNWVQKSLFYKHSIFHRQIVPYLKSPKKKSEIFTIAIIGEAFAPWIYDVLGKCKKSDMETWFSITGLEEVKESYKKGKGVLIVGCHTIFSPLNFFVLGQQDFQNIFILAAIQTAKRFSALKRNPKNIQYIGIPKNENSPLILQPMLLAQERLQKGDIVYLAGDGQHGTTGIPVPFHGRAYLFMQGFATLALHSNSEIFSARVNMKINGIVHIEYTRLKIDKNANYEENMLSLIHQYAHLVEQNWRDEPGNIKSYYCKRFLKLPLQT